MRLGNKRTSAHGSPKLSTNAFWQPSGRLIGSAALEVESSEPAGCFLPLDELSIPLQEARWLGGTSPARALLGTWQDANAAQRFGLTVPKSGRLSFKWEAQSSVNNDQEAVFQLRLPQSLSNRVTLDLPQEKRASVDGGVVLRKPVPISAPQNSVFKALPGSHSPDRSWRWPSDRQLSTMDVSGSFRQETDVAHY